jgi:DNA-binding transcriptional regulator LsrR (DeoR family)
VHLLPVPEVTGSPESQRAFLKDAYVKEALAGFPDVSIALVGTGSIDSSQLLSLSGNVFSSKELNQLQRQGAVGDILLRFFDAEGKPIKTSLDDRVIGMQLE